MELLGRVELLGQVKGGGKKLGDVAAILQLSYRQVKRLWGRYRRGGPASLKHGNAGRESHRRKPEKLRRRILALVKKKYGGSEGERFGPTLAAEHLREEDGIAIDHETLRRWLLEEGMWSRQRTRKAVRKRRERKAHFGELVQMDGSFHEWLEGRGPRGCLMNMVDDAQGTVECRMGKEETIWAAVRVLRGWIEKYGVPCVLYTDWKNLYKRKATPSEQLRGEVPLTQFGKMCAKLEIRIIAANSPQAKGRVERNHGTHQDRLVKKLRRKQIASYEAANEYLQQEYLPAHNRRFAGAAAEPEDYHRCKPSARELNEIFRMETERAIGNDWVIRHRGRILQLHPTARHAGSTRSKALVCEWEDGTLKIYHRGQRIDFTVLTEAPPKPERLRTARAMVTRKPPANHPWRQGYANRNSPVASPPALAPFVGARPSAPP